MTWWQTVPTFGVAVLVYFVPGIAILGSAGVRRLNMFALAAPVSASVGAMTAVAAPFLKLPFNPTVYFVVSLCLAATTFVIRRIWRQKHLKNRELPEHLGELGCNGPVETAAFPRWAASLAAPLALTFAALIIGRRYILGFVSPENFSQTFDNVYHLNAVRFIADTQNGSSLTLGNLTSGSQGFYPAGMHDMMALVQVLSGSSVPAAINVTTIVIGALVWPLSCLFLVSRVVGYRPVPLLAAGVFAGAFSGFPYLMVAFGVLYPNHAAIAMLPVVLALLIEILGMSESKPSSWLAPALAICVTLPGAALTHPSTVVAVLGFGTPVVIAKLIATMASERPGLLRSRKVRFWTGVTLVYGILVMAAWALLRPSLGAAPWTPFQSNARAIGEILASAPMGATAAWILLPLTIIGIYVAVRQLGRRWWILGMYGVGGFLYLMVSSWHPGLLRTLLTGVWYNDSFRLAALLPVVTLPVVVLGAEWLAWRVNALMTIAVRNANHALTVEKSPWTKIARRLPGSTGTLAVCLIILILGLAAQGGTLTGVQDRMRSIFSVTSNSDLITTDELDVLKKVDQYVPRDDTVMAAPITGGSLVWAIADRKTVAPHIFGDRTPDEQLLIDHWDEAAYNSKVCPAIKKLRAFWALDFGSQTVIPTDDRFTGLQDVTADVAPGIEVVATSGKARLVRITACG